MKFITTLLSFIFAISVLSASASEESPITSLKRLSGISMVIKSDTIKRSPERAHTSSAISLEGVTDYKGRTCDWQYEWPISNKHARQLRKNHMLTAAFLQECSAAVGTAKRKAAAENNNDNLIVGGVFCDARKFSYYHTETVRKELSRCLSTTLPVLQKKLAKMLSFANGIAELKQMLDENEKSR